MYKYKINKHFFSLTSLKVVDNVVVAVEVGGAEVDQHDGGGKRHRQPTVETW